MARGIFVTGTDTGVGKTLITCALAKTLKDRGVDIGVMKPFQTGDSMDSYLLMKSVQVNNDIRLVNPYFFSKPLAPFVAARVEGREIEMNLVKESFEEMLSRHNFLIVEGAGGLLVPIKDNFFMSDLIKFLNLPILVIARLTLGTINHTLLTVSQAKSLQIKVLGVILNDAVGAEEDESAKTNPQILSEFLGPEVPILGIVPFLGRVLEGEFLSYTEQVARTIDIARLEKIILEEK